MVVYAIVPTAPLASIDPTRTLMDVWIPTVLATRLARCNCHRWRQVVLVLYLISLCTFALMPFLQPSGLLNLLILCGLPRVIMTILDSRAHIIWLLLQTFEFWLIQAIGIVIEICFAGFLGTDRMAIAIIVPPICFIAGTLDAVQYQSFIEVLVPILTMAACAPVLIATLLNIVTSPHDFVLLKFEHQVLTARETIVNGLVTFSIVVLSSTWLYYHIRVNMARQEATNASPHTHPVVRIQIASYRVNAKWQSTYSGVLRNQLIDSTKPDQLIDRQLQVVPDPQVFGPSDVMSPLLLDAVQSCGRYVNLLISCTWFVVAAGFPVVYLKLPIAVTVVPLLGLVLTLLSLVLFIGLYHRHALKRLCRTFDCVFLSAQFTIAHLCVCDLVYWSLGASCLVLSSWCWMHWLLGIDALLPDIRQMIHLDTKWRIPVVLGFMITIQVALLMDVLQWHHFGFQDRLWLELHIGGTTITSFGVISTMLARFVVLIPMCGRLLWRHVRRTTKHDLLLLECCVEYDAVAPILTPDFKRHWQTWKARVTSWCRLFIAPAPAHTIN